LKYNPLLQKSQINKSKGDDLSPLDEMSCESIGRIIESAVLIVFKQSIESYFNFDQASRICAIRAATVADAPG
jgi:hypothetical protein